jgi:hypothetical protein
MGWAPVCCGMCQYTVCCSTSSWTIWGGTGVLWDVSVHCVLKNLLLDYMGWWELSERTRCVGTRRRRRRRRHRRLLHGVKEHLLLRQIVELRLCHAHVRGGCNGTQTIHGQRSPLHGNRFNPSDAAEGVRRTSPYATENSTVESIAAESRTVHLPKPPLSPRLFAPWPKYIWCHDCWKLCSRCVCDALVYCSGW